MSGSKRSALSSFDVVEMHRRALHLPPCAAGQDAALACFARPLRQASGICRARQVGPQQQQQQPPLHQLHQEAICSWWPAGVPQPQRRLVVAHGRRKSVPTPAPDTSLLQPLEPTPPPEEAPKAPGRRGRKPKSVTAEPPAPVVAAFVPPPLSATAELSTVVPASADVAPSVQQAEPGQEGTYEGVKLGLDDDSREKVVLREQIGHDIYVLPRNLSEEAVLDESELPRKFHSESDSPREAARIRFELARDYWEDRHEHQQYVHDLAFQAHHYTRERAANIYANSRRVAGLMSAFEDDDYRLQNLAPSSIAPWARAEIVFYTEHQEFNQYITEHADEMVKKLPREAQEDELDLLDEALFLLRTDDDNAAAQRAGQQSAEQELLDQYLEGTLPGATLDNLAASYAKDIFDGQDEFGDDAGLGAGLDEGDGAGAGVDGAEADVSQA